MMTNCVYCQFLFLIWGLCPRRSSVIRPYTGGGDVESQKSHNQKPEHFIIITIIIMLLIYI